MLLPEVLLTGGSDVLKDVPTTLVFLKLIYTVYIFYRFISVGYMHAINTTVQKILAGFSFIFNIT